MECRECGKSNVEYTKNESEKETSEICMCRDCGTIKIKAKKIELS